MTLPHWQDVRNRNYEDICKQTKDMPLQFLADLKARAYELCPDYPWSENDDAFTWLWALTESLKGASAACNDLHEIINTVSIRQNSNQTYFAERYYINDHGNELPLIIRGVGQTRGEALVNLLDKEKNNGKVS